MRPMPIAEALDVTAGSRFVRLADIPVTSPRHSAAPADLMAPAWEGEGPRWPRERRHDWVASARPLTAPILGS